MDPPKRERKRVASYAENEFYRMAMQASLPPSAQLRPSRTGRAAGPLNNATLLLFKGAMLHPCPAHTRHARELAFQSGASRNTPPKPPNP